MAKSIKDKVISRIYGRKRGCIFSANDFLADFKRTDIDKALSTLTKEGTIERILTGIYYYPEYSELLKQNIAPKIEKIAEAIARKFKWDIQPTGNTALNYFNLSTQIPGNYIYLSDGPSKTYKISNQSISYKKTKLKEIKLQHIESKLLVQAIKTLGKEHISNKEINIIKDQFNFNTLIIIRRDTANVAGWIRDIILKICD